MTNRALAKPSVPPPPVPGARIVGANVDPDGKRTRLPGDTVRQVVTPGRIRNLASMFDKRAQLQSEEPAEVRVVGENVIAQASRRGSAKRVPRDENNNDQGAPPIKPVRSFASEIIPDDDSLARGDYTPKSRTLSQCSERIIEEVEEQNSFEDFRTPLRVFNRTRSRTVSREEKHNVDEIIITITDEIVETVKINGEKEVQLESNDNSSTEKNNLFVSCREEPDSISMFKGSMCKSKPKDEKTSLGEVNKSNKTVPHTDDINDNEVFEYPTGIECVQRTRTTSRGDEQSINGHIDNLFEFVEEHLSSKQSRSSRECLYQPRFSPAAPPNVAEMSQDCSITGPAKSNTSKNSKRVGNALATSTPQNSPQSTTNQNPSKLADEDVSFVSTIQDTSQVEAIAHYEHMIKRNERALSDEKQKITFLQKALVQARKERKPMHEVNAQKTLLVARERVKLIQQEIKRLNALVLCRRPLPNQCMEVRGSLTISNVAVHLNRNFYTKPYEISSHYSFLVMLKCGSEVECTTMHNLLAHQSSRLKVVHFDEKINFCNLPVDFCVMLEVYAIAVPEKESELTCASIIASKCRSLLPKEKPPTSSPSGFPYGEFVRCGYVQLTRDTTGTNKFYLDEVEYPLDGTIEITTHCTTLPPAIAIDYSGFLTMYQNVSGMSSWERYWAVLRRGIIFFWKYPEDERMEKAPKARLDLSTCPQYEVHPCSVEQCPRPYTFTVNVLVNTAPSVMDKKRIFLAADSKMLMKDWLESINETLAVIRGNHPYKGSILPRN